MSETPSPPNSPKSRPSHVATPSVNPEKDMFGRIESILKSRKPYCSGTLSVTDDQLVVFYGKDRQSAGRIDFSDVTTEDLEHLSRACDQATFGVNQESVLNEQYRKSKKLDTVYFNPLLDTGSMNVTLAQLLKEEFIPDKMQNVSIRLARYKLNVYEPGSFFKPHVDTPRGENMFGSLVIVFPTEHEGGSLVLRDAGKEWVVDAAHDIEQDSNQCVAFIAFYGDVEHEVLPITSGYRVTMTYNLYYERAPSITYVRTTINEAYRTLKAAFEEMLTHPDILPSGGYLGFGLQREYGLSAGSDLKRVESNLKGSDALLLLVCRELSLDASLRMLYASDGHGEYDVLSDEIREWYDTVFEDSPVDYIDGIRVTARGEKPDEGDTEIKWVMSNLHLGYVAQEVVTYGNEPALGLVYGHVCLIVALGPYGDRRNVDNL